MGGARVVLSIGVSLKRFIAQWIEQKKDVLDTYESRVSLYTSGCVVSKVQQYFLDNNAGPENAGCAYISTTAPPSGDNFVQGEPENNYETSYLFKTPLVIKYIKEDGNVVYTTFKTSVDEE
jgi:hypothetical protein